MQKKAREGIPLGLTKKIMKALNKFYAKEGKLIV